MSRLTRLFLVFAFSFAGLFASSAEQSGERAEEGPLVKGVVTRILEDRRLVMVKHEEIPGVMRAMTMAFSVPEAVWDKLEPGVYLTGILGGGRGDWRLSDVKLTDWRYNPLPEEKEEAAPEPKPKE